MLSLSHEDCVIQISNLIARDKIYFEENEVAYGMFQVA